MADERQSGALQLAAGAARTVQAAAKAGKTVSGAAKGAAAGGPYGAAAMAIWENRQLVVKIAAAAAFLLALPVLYIMMLPSLIFGGLAASAEGILNDNAAIYANIEDVTRRVGEAIDSARMAVLARIDTEIQKLAEGTEHETIDDFDATALFDTALLISQYCAFKDNYEEISTDDLIAIIEMQKENLFLFEMTQQEKPIQIKVLRDVKRTVTEYIDGLILDDRGQYRMGKIAVIKEAWIKEEVEEIQTVMVATFTVRFVGADYFANEVFKLDEEKTVYANELAQNLAIFLGDFYDENVPSNGTHGSIANMIKDDNSVYTGGEFAAPAAGWKPLVTSEFGNRTHPVTGEINSFHSGIDIGLAEGTEVRAAADGTVLFVKKMSTGYVWHLAINHGGKLVTLYAHLSKILVTEGQEVHKGDPIAESGDTGRTTGPHLHFEVIVDGKPIEPRGYIK